MRRFAILALVTGCSYHASSFTDWHGQFAGTQLTVGCIDVAVAGAHDARAAGPVIAYGFGNRCRHGAIVDLASVRVIARSSDGRERALAPYDPRGEIRALPIDGLWTGRERIEYVDPEPAATVALLVDVGGIDGGAPRSERWVEVMP